MKYLAQPRKFETLIQMPRANLFAEDIRRRCLEAENQYANDHQSAQPRGDVNQLYPYPAMMAPSQLRQLFEYLDGRNSTRQSTIFDPFVGSGTSMTESMRLGHSFVGVDINPLAILICNAKIDGFNTELATYALSNVMERARSDRSNRIETNMPNQSKWYTEKTSIQLSRIKRAVRFQPDEIRSVCWLAFANTCRLTSNDRSSTYKLHSLPHGEVGRLSDQAFNTFLAVSKTMVANLEEFVHQLQERKLLSTSHSYLGDIFLHLGDTTTAPWQRGRWADALITSPPYGDNKTTVPYGQASYLQLQWLVDSDVPVPDDYFGNASKIDTLSLGGSKKRSTKKIEQLSNISPSARDTFAKLKNHPQDRVTRVASFWSDLSAALDSSLTALKPKAVIALTLGNRRVGGLEIPTKEFVDDLLEMHECRQIVTLTRDIPKNRKRTPLRNNFSSTMLQDHTTVYEAP